MFNNIHPADGIPGMPLKAAIQPCAAGLAAETEREIIQFLT